MILPFMKCWASDIDEENKPGDGFMVSCFIWQ